MDNKMIRGLRTQIRRLEHENRDLKIRLENQTRRSVTEGLYVEGESLRLTAKADPRK